MMCKNKSSVFAKFKPLLLVPIISALFLIFTCTENTKGQTLPGNQAVAAQEVQDVNPQVMPPDEVLEQSFPDEMMQITRKPDQANIEPDEVQQDTVRKEREVFYIVEEMPTFNDGDAGKEFRKYIAQNLQYPESAARDSISGRVIVQFCVNYEGKLIEPMIVRSVCPALDKEAIRVVSSSPLWTPGKQRGKEVDVLFTFPINFVIQ